MVRVLARDLVMAAGVVALSYVGKLVIGLAAVTVFMLITVGLMVQRTRTLSRSLDDILRQQAQQRRLLTAGNREPPPIRR